MDLLETEAQPALRSPKRGRKEREGVHSWFPYYAGFSAAFVSDVIDRLSLPTKSVILDPMNGSGTTTVVAQQRDCLSVGVELNPAMAILARGKDASLAGKREELEEALSEVRRNWKDVSTRFEPHPNSEKWIPRPLFVSLKRIEGAVDALQARDAVRVDDRLLRIVGGEKAAPGIKALLHAALLIYVRRVARPAGSKNPTWFKPGAAESLRPTSVFEGFASTARELQSDVDAAFPNRSVVSLIRVLETDARGLPLPGQTADAIITSPPYLTRIDYAVSTAPELVFLGFESEESFHALRSSIMGSTCITGGDYEIGAHWGKTARAVARAVRGHESKASASYYFKTHVQYFRDAEAIVGEWLRVLRTGASAFVVVQDSWYKDVHIPLGIIYAEIARELGADTATIVKDERIRSHLGLVNTPARRYPKGGIAEQVVEIRR